jgi:hypothetical protein
MTSAEKGGEEEGERDGFLTIWNGNGNGLSLGQGGARASA